MSGRCKSCDNILTDIEMRQKNPENEAYLELCFDCLKETKLSEAGYYDSVETIDGMLFGYSKFNKYTE